MSAASARCVRVSLSSPQSIRAKRWSKHWVARSSRPRQARFGWYVGADRRDPDRHQLVLSLGGIGLPDRDYYLLDTEQYVNVRSEYVAHIERMLGFAGIENAAEKAQAVLALETAFAENLWPRADRRNRDLTFNPMTYAEFKAAYPAMDWDAYWACGRHNRDRRP